jgi:glycosyltransferase involved in cell wall biosynthesis
MEEALVSIITITMNRGNLLRRCIQSVLSQTYSNIEYVVVDGASTDNTDEVLKEFSSDNRLKYIKLESNLNHKESYAVALQNTHGKYLTFLDSDDEYLLTKIEKQVTLFESLSGDYGMVYCWMSYFDNTSNRLLKVQKAELRGFVGDEIVEKPSVSGTPTFMIRRNAFIESGGWNYDIGIISDWEFASRFCQKWKVDYVPESLVKVYVKHGSLRMSENSYYESYYEKTIIFHNYFLQEFKEVFDKYPKKRKLHLDALVNNYIYSNQFKMGWNSYIQLLKIDFTFKSFVRPFYLLSRKLIRKQK